MGCLYLLTSFTDMRNSLYPWSMKTRLISEGDLKALGELKQGFSRGQ